MIGIGNIVSGFFIDGICVVPLALAIDVIFYYSCIRMQNITYFVSIIEMNFTQILIIHDCTCKLIHKKCQWKSYHNVIRKYFTALSTIFSTTFSISLDYMLELVVQLDTS